MLWSDLPNLLSLELDKSTVSGNKLDWCARGTTASPLFTQWTWDGCGNPKRKRDQRKKKLNEENKDKKWNFYKYWLYDIMMVWQAAKLKAFRGYSLKKWLEYNCGCNLIAIPPFHLLGRDPIFFFPLFFTKELRVNFDLNSVRLFLFSLTARNREIK